MAEDRQRLIDATMRAPRRTGLLVLLAVALIGAARPNPVPIEELSGPQFPDDRRFEAARAAYEALDVPRAIAEVTRIRAELTPERSGETLVLLADLYASDAASDPDRLANALSLYREARSVLPEGDAAIRALWRMGQTYAHMGFQYEAAAAFRRVTKYPSSPYALAAQLDLAESLTFRARWRDAEAVYRQVTVDRLAPADQVRALAGMADAVGRLGRYEDAFRLFERAERAHPHRLRERPDVLFSYAHAAFMAERWARARDLFQGFANIYTRDPRVPLARTRIADTWRMDQRAEGATFLYDEVLADSTDSSPVRVAAMMAAAGQLALHACRTPNAAPCPTEPSPAEIALAAEVTARVRDVLADSPADRDTVNLVGEAIDQLRAGGFEMAALDLYLQSHRTFAGSPLRRVLAPTFERVLIERITAAWRVDDPLQVITTYYRYRPGLSSSVLNGSTGMIVAKSCARLDLLSDAISLLRPMAGTPSALGEEAAFLLAQLVSARNDLAQAQDLLERAIAQYPRSALIPQARMELAQVLDQQGETDQALAQYRLWLSHYPKHPLAETAVLRLAKLHGRLGHHKAARRVLADWAKTHQPLSAAVSVALADTAFAHKAYREAATHYAAALKGTPQGSERAWIEFRLAASYAALNDHERSAKLFEALAQGPDTVVAQIAAVRLAILAEGVP